MVFGVPVLELAGAVGEVAVALGVDAVGVGLDGRGTVPVAEVAPGVLGARAAAGFAVEDGAALEDGLGVFAVPVVGAPAAAAAFDPATRRVPGWVVPASGSPMPDASGRSGELSGAGCAG